MNLQSFTLYLETEKLSPRSIQEHVRNLKRFQLYTTETGLAGTDHLTYTEVLNYVQHLKGKNLNVSTINIRLCSLRKYYEHLKEEGIAEKNPVRNLHIKGAIKTIVKNPLSYTELEALYHQYQQYNEQKALRKQSFAFSRLRNSVMLGLIIFQGAHSGEMKKMQIENVNLNNGSIRIPATGRGNARELSLHPLQILPLSEYIQKLPADQTDLFTGRVNDLADDLMNEVKGINPSINNLQHIRSSVILHWLKMYGKRQVQHKIGHKHIVSTERYEVQQVEELTDQLKKYHPFG